MSDLNGYLDPGALRKIGRTDGATIGAGLVGEVMESIIVTASALTLTTGLNKTITSLPLTAGIWAVSSNGILVPDATAQPTDFRAGLSDTLDGAFKYASGSGMSFPAGFAPTAASAITAPCREIILNITASMTLYLNMYCVFSAGVMKAKGAVIARRVS